MDLIDVANWEIEPKNWLRWQWWNWWWVAPTKYGGWVTGWAVGEKSWEWESGRKYRDWEMGSKGFGSSPFLFEMDTLHEDVTRQLKSKTLSLKILTVVNCSVNPQQTRLIWIFQNLNFSLFYVTPLSLSLSHNFAVATATITNVPSHRYCAGHVSHQANIAKPTAQLVFSLCLLFLIDKLCLIA